LSEGNKDYYAKGKEKRVGESLASDCIRDVQKQKSEKTHKKKAVRKDIST